MNPLDPAEISKPISSWNVFLHLAHQLHLSILTHIEFLEELKRSNHTGGNTEEATRMIKEARRMLEKMRRQSCRVQRELANEELRKARTRGSIASESDQLKHGWDLGGPTSCRVYLQLVPTQWRDVSSGRLWVADIGPDLYQLTPAQTLIWH